MSEISKDFRFIIPAELSKSEEGDWIVQGLASTSSRDQQGEVILPEGIDTTAIDQGRGVLNWDHGKGPENTVGLLDGYSKGKEGFFIKGRLFKNHQKAKSIHEIMSSLGKSDKGRMGLSVEGKILQRTGKDGKTIKKCQINAVALTMNPVNQDSYADLVKSLNVTEIDFQATEENLTASSVEAADQAVFTANQVMQLIQKALGAGAGYATQSPGQLSGGDALATEDLDSDKPKKKKLKPCTKDMYKSYLSTMIDKIATLYPNNSKEDIWTAVKDRLSKKFPEVDQLVS